MTWLLVGVPLGVVAVALLARGRMRRATSSVMLDRWCLLLTGLPVRRQGDVLVFFTPSSTRVQALVLPDATDEAALGGMERLAPGLTRAEVELGNLELPPMQPKLRCTGVSVFGSVYVFLELRDADRPLLLHVGVPRDAAARAARVRDFVDFAAFKIQLLARGEPGARTQPLPELPVSFAPGMFQALPTERHPVTWQHAGVEDAVQFSALPSMTAIATPEQRKAALEQLRASFGGREVTPFDDRVLPSGVRLSRVGIEAEGMRVAAVLVSTEDAAGFVTWVSKVGEQSLAAEFEAVLASAEPVAPASAPAGAASSPPATGR